MILDKKYFKLDSLTLMAGAPITVNEYGILIYQPKIKDIALIGESKFFEAVSIFKLNKKTFLESIIKNKKSQEIVELTNFFYDKKEEEILIYILYHQLKIQQLVEKILFLIFEDLNKIDFYENHIFLSFGNGHQIVINSDNFYILKDIINQIFSFDDQNSEGYKPAAGAAEFIAKKLEERKRKLAQSKNEETKESGNIIADYITVLAIGSNNFNIEDLLNMTIYQLFKLMKKYSLYEQYQMQIKSLMAGATDIELVDWIKQN